MQALKKYSVFFKATLTDISDAYPQMGYQGNEVNHLPNNTDEQYTTDTYVIIKLPGIPDRYHMIGHAPVSVDQATTFDAWKKLDIANKIPAIYPATTEKFLPHELGLLALNAVSLNKGCYTGQEIIARMHYRGKLKTRLYRARTTLQSTCQHGQDIYTIDRTAGNIVDYVQMNDKQYELLVIAPIMDDNSIPLFIDNKRKYPLELLGVDLNG